MFGFLKKKLGEVISKFSEKVKEEPKAVAEIKEPEKPKLEAAKPAAAEAKAEAKKEAPVAAVQEKEKAEERVQLAAPAAKAEARKEEIKPQAADYEQPKKKGLFEKITGTITEAVTTAKISEEKFEQMFSDMEMTLLENNAAVEVIGKIKADLKQALVDKPLPRGKIEEAIRKTLRGSIEGLFASGYDFKGSIKKLAAEKKPYKVMFVGINGSGKTTTIAKMTKMLQDEKLKVVIAAADTFRAAAIHQLQEHADKLGVKLIKHDYGADPAAVAFDAIKYAEAHGIDIVLIDTAGRLHSNVNLVDEMKKIARVAKPDMKVFVGESITGNDCVEQARSFNEAIGIDGIILSKADIDEKGGAAISVSYITQKPILFLGTGQGYGDLEQFNADAIVEQLGL
ncbi:signal recognition particle-docking protein FtsY [Candidatus Woesearchaeota archaeon]|nr:signal recognition particle-docking protein FtsY [Candidatus Woesearchaeota archaeon]